MSEATSKTENRDPVTGRPLQRGIYYRAPKQYQAHNQIEEAFVHRDIDDFRVPRPDWANHSPDPTADMDISDASDAVSSCVASDR